MFNKKEKEQLTNLVEDALNGALCEFYDKHNIKTGDITPDQAFKWDELRDKMVDLMLTLAEQNSLSPQKHEMT